PYATPHQRDPAINSLWDASPPERRTRLQELQRRQRAIRRRMTSLEESGVKRMSAPDQRKSEGPQRKSLLKEKLHQHLNESEREQYAEAREELRRVEKQIKRLPPPERVLALARCEPDPGPMHIHLRGSPHAPGDVVQPHFPEIFGGQIPQIPPAASDARSAGRRRVLADWIASDDNMLTARVIVNRVWQFHFGRGLVRSASNFGQLGTPPTHPELLDWLATWLIEHDWRLKPLHRLIMTSSAYQMSSVGDREALAADPTNELFWRYDMRRLSAEELRDASLVVVGRFNPQMFGPSFYSNISDEALATQSRPGDGWGKSSREQRARRSLYIHVKRSLITPLLEAFDFPDPDVSCEARFATTQPGQALAMLNGEFFNDRARDLAARVVEEAGDDVRRQVAHALRLTLVREPQADEIADGERL
ncbi:MAG: DUF1553 domain-containing protein, partial [Planctomycetota bacterium]